MRILIGALLCTLALAAPAAADTYCVAPANSCDHNVATMDVQSALTMAAAHPGDDVVQLGAATYSPSADLTYPGPDVATLQGAGPTQTTVQSNLLQTAGHALIGGTYSTGGVLNVRNLGVTVAGSGSGGGPESDGAQIATKGTLFENLRFTLNGDDALGLRLDQSSGQTVRNVTFTVSPGTTLATCVETIPGSSASTAQYTLTDITATGCTLDFEHPFVSATAERANLTASEILAGAGGAAVIDNSLIRTPFAAVTAFNQATVTINQSTLISTGSGNIAIQALNGVPQLTKVAVFDTIIRGFGTSLNTNGSATHPVQITGAYDSYGTISPSPVGTITISNPLGDVDPLFTSASDFTLQPTSPLLDRDPTALTPFESATDFAGNARIINTKRDIGAYERPVAPTATTNDAATITQTTAAISGAANEGGLAAGGTAQLVYGTGSDFDGSLPLQVVGVSADGVPITGTLSGLQPGTKYHFALRVQTALGTVVSPDRTFTTASPPHADLPGAVQPGGSLTPPPGGIAKPPTPVVRSLSLSPRAFTAARSGSTLASPPRKKPTGGATLTISMNVKAAVTFTVARQELGVLMGKTCVARGHGRHGKACTRVVRLQGSTTRTLNAGTTRLRFSARVAANALKPARYVLTATPRGGKARTVTFTVKPPR